MKWNATWNCGMLTEKEFSELSEYTEQLAEEIRDRGTSVIRQWREVNPNEQLRLVEEDLRNADLTDADLDGADLSDARLQGADLHCAKLVNANLSGANLSSANLTETDLSGTQLDGANLGSSYGTPIANRKQMEYIAAQRTAYLLYSAKD